MRSNEAVLSIISQIATLSFTKRNRVRSLLGGFFLSFFVGRIVKKTTSRQFAGLQAFSYATREQIFVMLPFFLKRAKEIWEPQNRKGQWAFNSSSGRDTSLTSPLLPQALRVLARKE